MDIENKLDNKNLNVYKVKQSTKKVVFWVLV